MDNQTSYTAFMGSELIGQGPLKNVVLKAKKRLSKVDDANVLIFNDRTGGTIDIDLTGSDDDVVKRLRVYLPSSAPVAASGPGRPKLGVVAREISLLPQHWEWLATQSGGASVTIRKLVDEARKASAGKTDLKQAQERTYRFMSVVAGDLPGYEEALRALYRKNEEKFEEMIGEWPDDIQSHLRTLSKLAFA